MLLITIQVAAIAVIVAVLKERKEVEKSYNDMLKRYSETLEELTHDEK